MSQNLTRTLLIIALCALFIHCKTVDVYEYPAFAKSGNLNAVIEIPAGTNTKIEYHPKTKKFTPDQRNGKTRIIEFLPYPANYGFIPGTLSEKNKGGDGDALDILVLCPTLKTGTVIEVTPIAMIDLLDDGEMDTKILAIPADEHLRTISSESLIDLNTKYPGAVEIIVDWFQNYDTRDDALIRGVLDEKAAVLEIQKNLKF
ncbi:inorganic diphosphatase [Dokdonia sinensis]|uniref:inorganic diphosphatase n=1 Tax=Dokdonia sinensis TaxID=2479847 RepID=A0A3M0FV65_9FLAO|nr:inorganic diphosphatase [Dokdonia sinensis]RMB56398.1 inorganic diphosphatase [Dokdonia sinensis]